MTDETPGPSPDDEIRLLDLLLVLAENARLLVFGPLIAGLAGLGIAFLITPTFTASSKILPPRQQRSTAAMIASQIGALAGIVGATGLNLKNPADLYVALLKNRTIADRIIDRFKSQRLDQLPNLTVSAITWLELLQGFRSRAEMLAVRFGV